MNAGGTMADGTMASSWMQATGPSVNLKIGRENAYIATPGGDEFDTPDETAAASASAQATADAASAAAAAEQTRIATLAQSRPTVKSTSAKLCSPGVADCRSGLRSLTVRGQKRST